MAGTDHTDKTHRLSPHYLPDGTRSVRRINSVVFSENVGEDRYPADVLHLAELVPLVRQRLEVPADFSDDAILSSLKRVASRTSDRERWSAAFDCNLARCLSSHGRDLGQALQDLITLIPPPRM
ncbi:MAG: hypothetical protein KJ622_12590 [Alphaproteobacteria bacterium]|nr:hypothetical protein [Alphaproteobacteria bacterium]